MERRRHHPTNLSRILSRDGGFENYIASAAEKAEQRNQALQRGKESEQHVLQVLRPLPEVAGVEPIVHESSGDLNGKDLIVLLHPSQSVKKVSVQVKSSEANMEKFKRDLAARLKIPSIKVSAWMVEHAMMLLNGRIGLNDELIIFSFREQLRQINDYARSKEKTAT